MKKQLEPLIMAGLGVLLLCFGVYAALTGDMKSRNGKPIDPGRSRLLGLMFIGAGGYFIVSSGRPNDPK